MSKLKVNELDTESGTTITVAAGKTIAGTDIIGETQIAADAVTADKLAAGLANATHTGDVTGATTLTIATDAVDIAMLSATGTASATTFLRGDNSWQVVSDNTTQWQSVQTSGFTAVAGNGYPCNTTSGAFTITLPGTASVGDTIELVDYAGTWDTNGITLDPQSLKIKGSTDDTYLVTERQGIRIVYVDATQGWVAVGGINAVSPAMGPPAFVAATGPDGAAGITDGDYKYHVFNATKTGSNGFAVSNAGNPGGSNTVDFLVIAGGGAGGTTYYMGGGGGAGGYRASWNSEASGGGASSETGLTVTVQNYDVTIGAGGAGSADPPGAVGNDSVWSTITSDGGGGGGNYHSTGVGGTGGSGGGGGGYTGNGGAGTANQGYAGSDAYGEGGPDFSNCGAGGGAGAVGTTAATGEGDNAPAGGAGVASTITGSSVTRGGGGGGGKNEGPSGGSGGAGGAGGGGAGSTSVGTAGTANTGGGGGGSERNGGDVAGASGGSGVVILRYKFQ